MKRGDGEGLSSTGIYRTMCREVPIFEDRVGVGGLCKLKILCAEMRVELRV